MSEIVIDFETASSADLSKVGADIYSKHITTEILSLTYAIGDGEPQLWVPSGLSRNASSRDLTMLALDPNNIWICHNAAFEKSVWRNLMVPVFGFPDIPNDRWHDTMASCALRTWPLALDNALHTAGLPGKDMMASKLTRALSKPDKAGRLDRSPETMAKVYAYNKDDVVKERGLHKLIGYLPPMEREVWLLDQEINERGVKFDIPMVRGALKIYEAARLPLLDEFREITGVNPTQCAKFKDWLSFNGVELANMRKETVNALLGLAEEQDDGDSETADDVIRGPVCNLPPIAQRTLVVRSLVGSASVKKYGRMELCADPIDGRIRYLLQYHGAGTGRWAGRLFNAHNMPRGLARVVLDILSGKVSTPDPARLAAAITTGRVEEVDALGCFIEYGSNRVPANPIEVLASALRNTIIADEGKHLLVGDWSAIEARLVLSIAGEHSKTALMASGADVYLDMAEQIFGVKGLTKADTEKRQIGKNTILGCGFQMGAATFHSRYCSDQPMEFAERAIAAYRKEWAPEVPKLWKILQNAALSAVQGGDGRTDRGITYQVKGDWLVGECMDGSQLYYFKPTLCRAKMPWSTDEAPDWRMAWRYQVPAGKAQSFGGGASGNWVTAYGGLLTENFVQHMARQLLCRALGMCKDNGLPVILHNQDEIIVEHTNPDVAALKQIMEDRPRWATAIQLPLAAECHPPCTRYHK